MPDSAGVSPKENDLPRMTCVMRRPVFDAEAEDAADLRQRHLEFVIGPVVHPLREALEDLVLGWRLHREDEGKVEARLVELVEMREALEFLGRQCIEPGPRLLGASNPRSASTRVARSGCARISASCASRLAAFNRIRGRPRSSHRAMGKAGAARIARHPWRMFRHIAEGGGEFIRAHGIDLRRESSLRCESRHQASPAPHPSFGLVAVRHGIGIDCLRLDLHGRSGEAHPASPASRPWAPRRQPSLVGFAAWHMTQCLVCDGHDLLIAHLRGRGSTSGSCVSH